MNFIRIPCMNYIRFFPFHVWQAYYDAHQKPPVWGERPHFTDGIIDYYAELLGINRGHRLLNSCAFQRGKTTLKVMKNAHAALARGLEIVTGNCLTG